MSWNWNLVTYSDGSNPYICKTKKELNRLRKKYGECMEQLRENYWYVRIPA